MKSNSESISVDKSFTMSLRSNCFTFAVNFILSSAKSTLDSESDTKYKFI